MSRFFIVQLPAYIKVIRQYGWRILLVSAGLSVAFTVWWLTRPIEYECETELVPPDLSMASPLLREAALVPGTASDLERVYSYLHSHWLQQALIDSFHLYERFGLGSLPSPARRARKMKHILDRLVTVQITRNSTLLITVRDTSAQLTYEISAFLVRQVERFCKGIIRMQEALDETQNQLKELTHEIRALEAHLSELRVKYRIFPAQEENARSLLGSPDALRYYDQVLSEETRLRRLQEAYARLVEEKIRREDFLRVYPQSIFLIQPPYKPLYPAGLERWVVILLSVLG
ncbi:MAG: hypothetical protein D6750_01745, partial [Bacteroidetes bacterium]